MNYEKSWTTPGQSAPRLDQELPIISEDEILRYLQKNLDEQDQIDEIIGKIKSAIAKHKDKKDFKKNASKLAKQHRDQQDSHSDKFYHHKGSAHALRHQSGGKGRARKDSHDTAGDHHKSAKDAHALAKKAADKGDHEAYKKHAAAAKKHSEKAKGSTAAIK